MMCEKPISKWANRAYLLACALCIVWAVFQSVPQ
jgi:hypothetical protein